MVHDLPPIDQLCLSQGQVFAITCEGGVWTWGLPGDRSHDPAAVVRTPEQVGSFFGKKRIRQLCCGRKHYVIVTLGAYGPSCTIRFLQDPPFQVEKWLRFTIISRNLDLDTCETGGAKFNCRLVHIDDEAPNVALGSIVEDTVVEVNDDMNGTYSGRCRVSTSGSYLLHVSLHGLPIEESPYEVYFEPCEIYPPLCEAQWSKAELICAPGESFGCSLFLRDKFKNPIKSSQDSVAIVQVSDKSSSIIFKQSYPCDERIDLVCPEVLGQYDLLIGIDGLGTAEKIEGCPFLLNIQQQMDLVDIVSRCQLSYPPHGTVGEDFIVTARWKQQTSTLGLQLRSHFTPGSHTLSARALVRCGHTFDTQTLLFDSSWNCKFHPTIASEYKLVVVITNGIEFMEIITTTISIMPGRAHADFTEIVNGKAKLSAIQESHSAVDVCVQLRDGFGNACKIRHPNDVVLSYLSPSRVSLDKDVQILQMEESPGGFNFNVPALDGNCDVFLHLTLNGEPVMYSPFSLRDRIEDSDTEELLQVRVDAPKDAARLEMTRRRAEETLRRERRRVQEEHEKNLKLKAMKRIGGGFIVQFDKL